MVTILPQRVYKSSLHCILLCEMNSNGRVACLTTLVNVSVDVVKSLFFVLWQKAHGVPFEENDEHEMESESVAILAEQCKIKTQPFPRVDTWDIRTVTYALEVESLESVFHKEKLAAVTDKGVKTKFCMNMRKFGQCGYGSRCFYAHSEDELKNVGVLTKYKTTMCSEYPNCTRGKNCNFAHGQDELRAATASKQNVSLERFEPLKVILLGDETKFAQYTAVFAEASTHMEKAVHSIRYLRNILAHLPASVQSTGITQECFDCLFQVLTEAGLCISKVVGGNSFQKFEESNVNIICDFNRAGYSSALVVSPSVAVHVPPVVDIDPAVDVLPAVYSWSEDDVRKFFVECRFPTQNLPGCGIDGASLVMLFQDIDSKSLFVELGFPVIMYIGRLHSEMEKLGVTREARVTTPQQ